MLRGTAIKLEIKFAATFILVPGIMGYYITGLV